MQPHLLCQDRAASATSLAAGPRGGRPWRRRCYEGNAAGRRLGQERRPAVGVGVGERRARAAHRARCGRRTPLPPCARSRGCSWLPAAAAAAALAGRLRMRRWLPAAARLQSLLKAAAAAPGDWPYCRGGCTCCCCCCCCFRLRLRLLAAAAAAAAAAARLLARSFARDGCLPPELVATAVGGEKGDGSLDRRRAPAHSRPLLLQNTTCEGLERRRERAASSVKRQACAAARTRWEWLRLLRRRDVDPRVTARAWSPSMLHAPPVPSLGLNFLPPPRIPHSSSTRSRHT
eukprot:357597-Chlamydomonas_euryale.AAC.4